MRTLDGVPGFSFGGIHSGDYGVYLAGKQPDWLPKTRDYEIAIYGRAGLTDFGSDLDVRPVLINLSMLGSDRRDLIENILSFGALFNPLEGYKQLVFDDDPGRYYLAKYTSAVTESQIKFTINRADFQLGFKCDDPFIYSAFPKTPSWAAVAGAEKTLFNEGTAQTPVVMTLTASTAVSNVQIGINGIYAIYNGTINPGDTVVIDTGEMTYQKNGVNAIQYWSGDFPKLQPGQNTIDCNVALNLTLSYRERWL